MVDENREKEWNHRHLYELFTVTVKFMNNEVGRLSMSRGLIASCHYVGFPLMIHVSEGDSLVSLTA